MELHLEHGIGRLEAWRVAQVPYWKDQRVEFGRLTDGRWYAARSRTSGGAYASTDEQAVRRIVDGWLADGQEWVPAPARFGPDGLPADGRRWRGTGTQWLLDEP